MYVFGGEMGWEAQGRIENEISHNTDLPADKTKQIALTLFALQVF